MNHKEQLLELINSLSDNQILFVLAMLKEIFNKN